MTDRKIKQSGDRNVNAQTVIGKIDTGDKTYLPPPVTVSALHQLPSPPAHFTGRSDELNQLLPLLERGGALIVGVRGMSGVGKTALAIVLSHQVKDRYPDAQFFLDLQGASDKPMTVAAALSRIISSFYPDAKLPEDEAQLQATYLSLLHEKRALVVLDNAPPKVSLDRLMPPPSCALLVTSQFNVVMRGLQAVPLDELPPDKAREYLLKVTPRIGEYADELARLCGYLPLALELVAGALQVRDELEPADYARRLEREPLRELDAVAATFALSYELLGIEQQLRWRTLAVFPNTFDTYAAAAVWEIADLDDALDMLSVLKGYSLISFDTTTRRWRLHDLARLFAAKKRSSAESDRAGRKHATYYIALLEVSQSMYFEGDSIQQEGLAMFYIELENIQAGQSWAEKNADTDIFTLTLCNSYPVKGYELLPIIMPASKRILWIQAGIRAAEKLSEKKYLGWHYHNLANCYFELNDGVQGIKYLEKAIEAYEATENCYGLAKIHGPIANELLQLEQIPASIFHYEKAYSLFQETGDISEIGKTLGNLSIALASRGDHIEAEEFANECLSCADETKNKQLEAHAYTCPGIIFAKKFDHYSSLEFFDKGLHICRDFGLKQREATLLQLSGEEFYRTGNILEAINRVNNALLIFERFNDPSTTKARRQIAEWQKIESDNEGSKE